MRKRILPKKERPRASTRLDEISEKPEEIKKQLKNFEKIESKDLASIKPGTFIRYLRFDPEIKKWKFRSGGILTYNSYPDYWAMKFRLRNGRWEPRNINLTNHVVFFKRKPIDYEEDEIRVLLDALKSGHLRLIKVDDLKRLLKNQRDYDPVFELGDGVFDDCSSDDDDDNKIEISRKSIQLLP